MSDELKLLLLGRPQILQGDAPVSIFHKAQALFYYLAVTNRPHPRSDLLKLLWHQIGEKDAKNNLRVTLSYLRRQFKDYLSINRYTVSFNDKAPYWLDVEIVRKNSQTMPITVERLREITKLYRGNFLEGFQIPEEKYFEEWVSNERRSILQLVIQAWHSLTLVYKKQGNYTEAIDAANLLLRLSTTREETHQLLMTLLAEAGHRSAALEQYEICRRVLMEEEGRTPVAKTLKMYQDIAGTSKPGEIIPFTQEVFTDVRLNEPQFGDLTEHRQVTLIYCHWRDVDQQNIPDLEAWQVQRQQSQQACIDIIHRFKGQIIRQSDSGLLLAFGCPQAYEDSAQWAVRAGLAVVEAFISDNREDSQLAVGIHTGLVILETTAANEEGQQAISLVGQTQDTVQQLARYAKPNTVLISSSTYGLIKGYFDCQALEQSICDIIGQNAYRVAKQNVVNDRLEASKLAGATLSTFVDRQVERDLLESCWEQAQQGQAKVVIIKGEVGVGKTRLVETLVETIPQSNNDTIPLLCRCYHPMGFQAQQPYPLATLLRALLAIYPERVLDEKLGKLVADVAPSAFNYTQEELNVLNSHFQSLYQAGSDNLFHIDVSSEKVVYAILALLIDASEHRPIFLAIEDMHKADSLTMMLLSRLFERQAQQPNSHLLTILTSRPEFKPRWPHYAHISILELSRLSASDITSLIKQQMKGHKVTDEIHAHLIKQSEGVPLFAEGLAQAISELPKTALQKLEPATLRVPASLYDWLLSPIESLGSTAKQVVKLASILGREFSYPALLKLWSEDEAELQRGLTRLVNAGLLYPYGELPEASYQFKYNLTLNLAYQSLLKRQLEEIQQVKKPTEPANPQ
jgi:DNA-binding SARP family transcriptional activator